MDTNKDLHCISVITSAEAEDAVANLLERHFGTSPTIWSGEPEWLSTVAVYCNRLPGSVADLRARLREGLRTICDAGLEIEPARLGIRRLREKDWAESWKRHFHLLKIGKALLIRPSWSRHRENSRQAVVTLDPGLSFGTGQHPTTRFCLHELVRLRPKKNKTSISFCDIGTGSGILAISAAKLGYDPVHAFDFDADCVRIARANLELNSVSKAVQLSRRDIAKKLPARSPRFDVVAANLMHDLLIAQRSKILRRLQPNGTLILAGILKSQFAEVRQAYQKAGWEVVSQRIEKEWQSGSFQRRK